VKAAMSLEDEGYKLWLSNATAYQTSENLGKEVLIPAEMVINLLDEYIQKYCTRGFDFEAKEFLSAMLCAEELELNPAHSVINLSSFLANSRGKVSLASFASFWKWFGAVFLSLTHPKILPRWRVGFFQGLIASDRAAKIRL